MKKFRIPMQFFADDSAGTTATGASAPADGQQNSTVPQDDKAQDTPAPASKTFSQADVDKIVADRLARQQKKFDAEKEEAAKLAKMNADQKAEYAAKKREEELTAREAAIQKKELRLEAMNILEENGLPSKLIDCVDLSSAEASKSSIDAIKASFNEAVSAQVDARLKSNPPQYSGGNNDTDAFLDGFMRG